MIRIVSTFAALIISISMFATTGNIYTPASLKENASTLVDKEIKVSGTVTHVCSHSGRKCFIAGDDNKDITIQVFAGGNIASFEKSLKDSKIEVIGVLKEHRMKKENIEKSEKDAKDQLQEENCNNIEQCHSVLNNIKEMKEWMAANNKDYYPIYFVESASYKIVK